MGRQRRNNRREPLPDPLLLVPQDARSMVNQHLKQCGNLSLILARYVPREVIENDDLPNQRHRKWRDHWMRQICEQFRLDQDAEWQRLAEVTYGRWDAMTANAQRFSLRSSGRLVIGLGGESVLETGLTLQYLTGLPIIPGSALKGLCRAYALMVIGAELGILALSASDLKDREAPTPLQYLDDLLASKDEEEQQKLLRESKLSPDVLLHEDAAIFREIFGSTADAGACVFYDAALVEWPPSDTLFEVDVMTPHFRQYYESNGQAAPSDDDNPNPINFLTVAAGTQFEFAVGLRHGQTDWSLVTQAAEWLQRALIEMGIGAKTAAGYGVFR